MVIATHEMAFARDVADEVCFLHEGRIHERGRARAGARRARRRPRRSASSRASRLLRVAERSRHRSHESCGLRWMTVKPSAVCGSS